MTWNAGRENWDTSPVPRSACDLHHLVEGMTGSDAPTGPMSIVMASFVRYCGMKTVVELGVWKGGTTVLLADACRDTGGTCWAIDKEDCTEARDRLRELGLEWPHCAFLKGDSRTVEYHGGPIDLLFIDAGHAFAEVRADWNRWTPLVRAGGYVFVDNAQSEEGVRTFLRGSVIPAMYPYDVWQYLIVPESYGMAIFRKGA